MPDVMADRRAAPRYPLILVAEVVDADSQMKLSARSSDLSRTGCYIDTLNPIPAGSAVSLRLHWEGQVFEAAGKIAYISPGLGMGIAFSDPIPPAQLAILDRWLDEAAKASDR